MFNSVKGVLKRLLTYLSKSLSCRMANTPARCLFVGLTCSQPCPDNNCGPHSLPANSPSKANSSPHKAPNHHKVALKAHRKARKEATSYR